MGPQGPLWCDDGCKCDDDWLAVLTGSGHRKANRCAVASSPRRWGRFGLASNGGRRPTHLRCARLRQKRRLCPRATDDICAASTAPAPNGPTHDGGSQGTTATAWLCSGGAVGGVVGTCDFPCRRPASAPSRASTPSRKMIRSVANGSDAAQKAAGFVGQTDDYDSPCIGHAVWSETPLRAAGSGRDR